MKERRGAFQEVETAYMEKKRVWDNVAVGLENDRSKLEYELDDNSTGFSREESQFHLLNSLILIEESKLARLTREKAMLKDGKEGVLLGKFSSYKHMLECGIRDREQQSRNLRKQQKDMQTDHGDNVRQRQSFAILRALLHAKLQAWQAAPEERTEHNFLKIQQSDQAPPGTPVHPTA